MDSNDAKLRKLFGRASVVERLNTSSRTFWSVMVGWVLWVAIMLSLYAWGPPW